MSSFIRQIANPLPTDSTAAFEPLELRAMMSATMPLAQEASATGTRLMEEEGIYYMVAKPAARAAAIHDDPFFFDANG